MVWTIITDENSLNGCNNEIVLPAFDRQIKLKVGENTIRFTPESAGSYPYSCWMGMVRSTITVVSADADIGVDYPLSAQQNRFPEVM